MDQSLGEKITHPTCNAEKYIILAGRLPQLAPCAALGKNASFAKTLFFFVFTPALVYVGRESKISQ
jgi:hypothetical protein